LRRQDVASTIWHDQVFEELSTQSKLFFLWSITNQACNVAGVYSVSKALLSECGLTKLETEKAISELEAVSLIVYEKPFLWVVNRIRHIRGKNPNVAKSIISTLNSLPADSRIKREVVDLYGEEEWLESLQTVDITTVTKRLAKGSETVPKPLGNTEVSYSVSGNVSGSGKDIHAHEKENFPEQAVKIFEYWKAKCGKPPSTKFTPERKQKVLARLKDGYDIEMIKQAIDWTAKNGYVR